ncbi:amidohydrolase [Caulobacter sp.]|uniref:amidohydrolase n=1 Tax=Caulobacter sp. TaxID=78 RepID=UPI001B070A4B|nr:amidohydrolase [Caulobacter sp.]MBO9545732.1 amidohydrolase [Caulobacter sp.]
MKLLASAVLATLLATTAVAAPLNVPVAKKAIDVQLDRDYPALEALYKDIHAHPELGFQEVETAKKLAAQMRALGFTVTENVGKTGVVAVLKNGDGPKILIRTELDGLPMQEKTGLPFASQATAIYRDEKVFTAHACGHDIHMAAWVGTAKQLVAMKAKWKGTLVFVAQPAEELTSGARAMLADGLWDKIGGKPDYGFALHVGNSPAGQISYKPGVLTSTSDGIDLTFIGQGGHGSMPSATIDPIMMASRFVVDVQSVVSREKDPSQFGVVTIGSIQGGSAGNIIPDRVRLRGTIRTQDAAVREKILAGVQRTAKAVAAMAGAPEPELKLTSGGKMVVNDADLTARTGAVFKAAFGAKAVLEDKPGSASEDYSEFVLAGVPSVYFGIGGYAPAEIEKLKAEGKPVPTNHSPFFAPTPEPTIRTGVEAMTLAVLGVLQK